MIRTCEACGGPNERPRAKICERCRGKAWRESERGIAYNKSYFKSERAQDYQKSFRSSEYGKAYKKSYRESAKRIAYRESEDGKSAAKKYRATQYGISVERLEELLAAGCFVPSCRSLERLRIDHDHGCCPGKKSCGNCVRGALCHRHNIYLGFLEADWSFAIWAMRQPSLVIKVRREA